MAAGVLVSYTLSTITLKAYFWDWIKCLGFVWKNNFLMNRQARTYLLKDSQIQRL